MSDINLPGLIVPIEARIDKLEKSLKKASQAQMRAARQMEAQARQNAQRIGQSYEAMGTRLGGVFERMGVSLGGLGRGGVAGLLAGATVGGAVNTMRQAARALAEIGDEAARAGIALDDFQRWRHVAETTRVSVDSLVDGFKELNLRADEFITTGQGSAAEAFQRLGFTAQELRAQIAEPSELMLNIIRRLQYFDRAGQIRIADEIFGGTGGERFVEMLARGEDGIRELMANATVLTDDQIGRAQELDRRYTELTVKLRTLWQSAAVGAADFVTQLLNVETTTARLQAADVFRTPAQAPAILGPNVNAALEGNGEAVAENREDMAELLALYERFGGEANNLAPALNRLSTELYDIGADAQADAIFALAQGIVRLTADLDEGEISATDFEAQMGALLTAAQEALAEITALDTPTFDRVIARLGPLGAMLASLTSQAHALREAMPGGTAEMTVGTPLPGVIMPPPPAAAVGGSGGSSGGGRSGGGGAAPRNPWVEAVGRLDRERASLEAETAALVAAAAAGMRYAEAMDYARTRAELLTAAQEAGRQATPELIAQIDQMARAQVTAGLAAEEAADRIRRIEEAGQGAAQTMTGLFMGILDGSMSAEDALMSLLRRLLEVQVQQMFLGMFQNAAPGGFLSFLGGLLGFAAGGYTGDGGRLEPAGIVHRGEFVMSKAATARLGVDNLSALHASALRGYADGGLVGEGGRASKALTEAPAGRGAQSISINAPVTVNATGGTHEQNRDLADQIGRQMERNLRGAVIEELRRQLRPGNMLGVGR